ncbi:hypothetical protein HDU87_000823 [Geranomyces variabilis]|uniref:Uncharacterized protein n=1 Tax=Geranomyces variabilis TaxID=109894 RepID=A0AAD5XPA4_9FUNG|nr:hypothetical protein HDU87_000823 [Geranomyces variabilis]
MAVQNSSPRLRCSNALPLIVIVLLAAIATGPLPAAGQGNTINCSGFSVNNQCYTDPRLKECVDRVAPAWPFAGPAPPPGGAPEPNCPSPAVDPTGFKTCLDASLPKPLPNATAVVDGCINSTGVVPVGSSATAPQGGAASPATAVRGGATSAAVAVRGGAAAVASALVIAGLLLV